MNNGRKAGLPNSHPNAAAHRAVAERLLPVVLEMLPDWFLGRLDSAETPVGLDQTAR